MTMAYKEAEERRLVVAYYGLRPSLEKAHEELDQLAALCRERIHYLHDDEEIGRLERTLVTIYDNVVESAGAVLEDVFGEEMGVRDQLYWVYYMGSEERALNERVHNELPLIPPPSRRINPIQILIDKGYC